MVYNVPTAHFARDISHHGIPSYLLMLTSLTFGQTNQDRHKVTYIWKVFLGKTKQNKKHQKQTKKTPKTTQCASTRQSSLRKSWKQIWPSHFQDSGCGKQPPNLGSSSLVEKSTHQGIVPSSGGWSHWKRWATRGRAMTPQPAGGEMGSTFILKGKILETYQIYLFMRSDYHMHLKSQGRHILLFLCCIHGFRTNRLRKTFPITEWKRKHESSGLFFFFFPSRKSDYILNSLP